MPLTLSVIMHVRTTENNKPNNNLLAMNRSCFNERIRKHKVAEFAQLHKHVRFEMPPLKIQIKE